MRSFGETLYLWREYANLTQQELALRSGISRPNLCFIEQGRREVTISTVRRLASALEIRPGLLVDGVVPSDEKRSLSRVQMDRIAQWISGRPTRLRRRERDIAEALKLLLAFSGGGSEGGTKGRFQQSAGKEKKAFRYLRSRVSAAELNNLISRVNKFTWGFS